MGNSREEVQQRLDRFQEVCRRAGTKLTHQRSVIFRIVAETDEHPDAETVYQSARAEIPTVSLDTVYRTLWMLHDLGLISTLGPPRERARFDANIASHHHFVCNLCGRAVDFQNDEFDALEVPDEVTAIGNVERARVELRGTCLDCSARESE